MRFEADNGTMRKSSIFTVIIVFISACMELVFPTTAAAIGRFYIPPEEAARYSKYIVVGRMRDIERDLIRFDDPDHIIFAGYTGKLYTKRVGRISVEDVILAPQGEEVPKTLKVYWGNNVPVLCPRFNVLAERFHRGAWIIMQIQGKEELILADAYFVYEDELADFKSLLSKGPPLAAAIYTNADRFILRIRHLNFSDSPSESTLWSLEDKEIFVPEPYGFSVSARQRWDSDNEPVTKIQSKTLNPENAKTISLDSNSFVEQEIDISRCLKNIDMDKLWMWSRLYVNDEPVGGNYISEIFADHITTSETLPPSIFGNWRTPVWWFPSEPRMRWLLSIFGPALLIVYLITRKKGNHRTSYACLGLLLGLIWALVLLKYLPEAVFAVKTWSLHNFGTEPDLPMLMILKGRPTGIRSFATFMTASFIISPFLIGFAIYSFKKRGKQFPPGFGLIWIFWTAIPLLFCTVNMLIPWGDPLM